MHPLADVLRIEGYVKLNTIGKSQLQKLYNPLMKWLLRSPFHFFVSASFMLITVTGRKTGKQYTTPVMYRRRDNEIVVVTSAKYTWWKNLQGGATVTVRVKGRNLAGQAKGDQSPAAAETAIKFLYPRMAESKYKPMLPGLVAVTIQVG